jgi:fatty acid amide hydrolase
MTELFTKSASELKALLDAGEISSVDAVSSCYSRIDAVNPAVNAVVWRRDDDALLEAKAWDEKRAAGEDVPALAGIPITIKESLDLPGSDATMGCSSRIGVKPSTEAVLVKTLRAAGAVVLGKTNIPQLLLAQETDSFVYGLCKNPWHLGHSPGGSSGGEAAAIATGMSPWGIGTDIGGSIRIPAHFCGIAGMKPTVDRWSTRGSNGAYPGQEVVRGQTGPMARTVDDLKLMMRAVDPASHALLDPRVAPVPLGDPDAIDVAKLRVGVYVDDGFLPAAPSQVRAVAIAKQALQDAGAEVVEYRPDRSADLVYLWMAAISADGARTMKGVLDGEKWIQPLAASAKILKLPAAGRAALKMALGLMGEDKLARLIGTLGEKRVQQYWDITYERTKMRRAEFDAWAAQGLDAVLLPAHSVPAMPHYTSGDFTLGLSYAFRYTFLNFPAGIVPVTRVQQADADAISAGGDRVEKKQAEIEKSAVGLPSGVQLVARPFREDLVLALLAAVEARVRENDDFPTTPIQPGVVG